MTCSNRSVLGGSTESAPSSVAEKLIWRWPAANSRVRTQRARHVGNCRASCQARKESPSSRSHMTQALWVAFTHFEVALACASKAVQDIHGVIECLFLFYVVSGLLKQFPRTLNKRFLRFSDTLGKFGRVRLKNCSSVQLPPLSAIWGFGNGNVHESLLSGAECYRRPVPYAALL